MKHLLLCLSSLILFCAGGFALADELPLPIRNGLSSYSKDGAQEAVKTWMENSPLKRTSEIGDIVKMLQNIERLCGTYRGYDIARVYHFSATTQFVYVQLNYTSCPIFGRFVAYQGERGWLVTQLNFNAKPENVLPPSMLVQ
jgi:hypothetical protein